MVLLKKRVGARLSLAIEPDVELKAEPRNEGLFRHFYISSSVLPGPRPPRPKSGAVHSIHSVNGMLRSAQFGRGVRNADEDAGEAAHQRGTGNALHWKHPGPPVHHRVEWR